MSETIPTIDAWNARLAPPVATDLNTSDSTYPEGGDCGCCLMPKCCPPRLECQSGVAVIEFEGWLDPSESVDSSDIPWERTRYLKRTIASIGDNQTTSDFYTDYDVFPPVEVPYNSNEVVASHYRNTIDEYSQAFSAILSGCIFSPSELTHTCEIGGTRTSSDYAVVHDGTYHVYKSHEETRVYSSADDSDTSTTTYGPCDIKCVITDKYWEWNYTTHTADLVDTITYVDYGDATFLGPSHIATTYTLPVTYAEFLVLANAWADAHRDEFFAKIDDSASSDTCLPGSNCYAERAEGTGAVIDRFFRYRWKLNKCCSLYSGLSWLEVFYSRAFLNWIADGGSGDAPDTPTPTVKSWEWTGMSRPAVCDESGSSTGLDPFDDPDTWSPWSLTVAVPDSEWGRVYIRDLYMTCYRSAYGTKPDFIPLYGTYDPSDLNEDGIPDSQQ